MTRLTIILFGALMLGAIAFGAGQTEEAAAQKGPGELRIAMDAWINQKFPISEAVDKFESDHPEIKIEVMAKGLEETAAYILEWKSNRTAQDLVLGPNPMKATAFVAQDLVVDWSDMLKGDLSKENWIEPFYEQAFINEKPYCMPFMGEVEALIARKDFFQEAGLIDSKGEALQPATPDELYQFAKKLTTPNRDGMHINGEKSGIMRSYLGVLQALQGTIYAADGKTIDFAGEESRRFLSWWRNIVADGYCSIATFTDHYAARGAFNSGTTALMLEPNSRWIEAADQIGRDKVALLSIPGAQENGSHCHVVGMVIPKVSPNQNAAKDFVREQVMSKWFQQWSATRYGKMPVLTRNYDGLADEGWQRSLAAVSKAARYPNYEEYIKLEALVTEEFQNCVRGKQTVDQAIKNVMTDMKKLDLTIY